MTFFFWLPSSRAIFGPCFSPFHICALQLFVHTCGRSELTERINELVFVSVCFRVRQADVRLRRRRVPGGAVRRQQQRRAARLAAGAGHAVELLEDVEGVRTQGWSADGRQVDARVDGGRGELARRPQRPAVDGGVVRLPDDCGERPAADQPGLPAGQGPAPEPVETRVRFRARMRDRRRGDGPFPVPATPRNNCPAVPLVASVKTPGTRIAPTGCMIISREKATVFRVERNPSGYVDDNVSGSSPLPVIVSYAKYSCWGKRNNQSRRLVVIRIDDKISTDIPCENRETTLTFIV